MAKVFQVRVSQTIPRAGYLASRKILLQSPS